MPEGFDFRDACNDPYDVEATETYNDGPCVHILWQGAGAVPRDILLDLAMAEKLHTWLNQWLAEQGQEAGEEAADGVS